MVARTPLQNLTQFDKLINPEKGTPTDFFMRLLQNSNILTDETVAAVDVLETEVAALEAFEIKTTSPIVGGPVALGSAAEITIAHDASGVVPDTYGDATHVAQVTVDEFGHVTDVDEVLIEAGISLEEAGVAVTGGPFTTLNFASGATVVDAGAGTADINISGGGGAYRPMVDGSVPPNLMYEPDGSLIMEAFTP